eukprot:3846389-Pleurochrysis_carterae.AAC.1
MSRSPRPVTFRTWSTHSCDGVPASVHKTHAPASDDLPKLVDDALPSKADSPPPPDLLRSYQSLVGALLYRSTQTRPDVAFAV